MPGNQKKQTNYEWRNDGIHGRQTRYSDGRPDKDEDRGTLGIPAADRQGRSLHLLPLPGGRSNEKHEIPGCRKAFQDGERSRADSLEHRRHKREGKVLHHRRRDRCPQPDSAGLEEVVSVPNGAGGANLQWLDRFVESHFDDKTEIILAMDTDKRGVELRDELVRRLGVDRCKVVAWGEGCKDANEYLLKYDLPRLRQQVEQAAEIPLEGVFCPMDEWDTLMDIYYNGMPEGADTGLENLDRLIKFERGFVLTVTGVPGSGKSEFVDEIAMRLLLRHDWKVGYFSPENTPLAYHYRKLIRRVVGKRFEHKGMPLPEAGQAIRYLAQSVFSIMPKEDFSVESVLRIAAQLVSRKGVKVLVVDPFNRFEHQIPDWETETQYISRIFDEFSNFAVKHKVLLILVAHPTKLRREPGSKRWPVPTLYDINGSAAFFNKTDYGMVVDRNDELGQVLVRVAKVRFDHLGGPGDAFFAFSTYNGRYTPTEERTLDHNPPEPKWEHTNFLTEKLKPEQQGLGFNEGE